MFSRIFKKYHTETFQVTVGRSVGRSVTTLSPAKTAQPIEMAFGRGLWWPKGTMY